jgi:hypothetical protein
MSFASTNNAAPPVLAGTCDPGAVPPPAPTAGTGDPGAALPPPAPPALTDEERAAATNFTLILVLAAQAGFAADVSRAATCCKTSWGDAELWGVLARLKPPPYFTSLSTHGWPATSRWLNAATRTGDIDRVRWLVSACGAELALGHLEVASDCPRDVAVDVMRYLFNSPALAADLAREEAEHPIIEKGDAISAMDFYDIITFNKPDPHLFTLSPSRMLKMRLLDNAAFIGNVALLRYLTVEAGCPVGSRAMFRAIDSGHAAALACLGAAPVHVWRVDWDLLWKYAHFTAASPQHLQRRKAFFALCKQQGGHAPTLEEQQYFSDRERIDDTSCEEQ